MGKVFDVEYRDVKDFRRKLKTIVERKKTDKIFINSCEKAMENTLREAQEETPVLTGELKSRWRKDVEKPEKTKRGFSQSATNKAYNPEAADAGKDPYYASFVEKGHKPVPWRKYTHGVYMLAHAENDTKDKLEGIVDAEIKKLLGGLFDYD